MSVHQLIASFFGIGYLGKGSGTIAAVVWTVILFLNASFNQGPLKWSVLSFLLISVVGVFSATKVEALWGKDHQRVVIDEVAGVNLALLFLPPVWYIYLIALILFRYFDIFKPLYIRRLEVYRGGIGTMADDWLAGLYANGVTQILLLFCASF